MDKDTILALSSIGAVFLIGLSCLTAYLYQLLSYHRINQIQTQTQTQTQTNSEYNQIV